MCDYSLMGIPNRLAREGEDLVVHEFWTGSRGLTPCTSLTNAGVVKRLFGNLQSEEVAVCIPPGARLLLNDIPKDVQESFTVGASEEVIFTQLTATANAYRDAVRFANGREILLQRLSIGQRVRVLQLSLSLMEESVQSVLKESEVFRY